MAKLRLCSSSFLLPDSQAWRPLAEMATLDFGSYGDWPQALLSTDPHALAWVLFLEDVIPREAAVEAGSPDALDGVLAPLLDPLTMRLERVKDPVVVAWSAGPCGNPVTEARARSPWRRMARHFADRLYELAARHPNLYLIALDDVFAGPGMKTAYDSRNFYAARCRLSRQGVGAAAGALADVLTRIAQPARKVLVLDCDNTLWGGVVGEVGLSGLVLGSDGLGKAFADFQRSAQRLARQGILLAVASKNNEAEVYEVFDRHSGMVLQRADIVAFRVDWSEKSANIAAMAEELGLGLDSIAFWDDNPLEREKMRLALPQVATIDVPADVTGWPALLDGMHLFARFTVTSEDLRKNEQYRSRSAFIEERRSVSDEEGFLRSIAMHPSVLPIDEASLARAEQLCAKTNQFNLRTIRHSAADLAALSGNCGECAFMVSLSDRFGDHGIVGLAIARRQGGVAVLDSFLLSCRVLGRRLERWMLDHLMQAARRQGCRWLVAQFIPSGRNAVAAGFLAESGLTPAAGGNLPADGELRAAVAAQGAGGPVYYADLETFVVPHLDVFSPCCSPA